MSNDYKDSNYELKELYIISNVLRGKIENLENFVISKLNEGIDYEFDSKE